MPSKIGYNVLVPNDRVTLFDHANRLNPESMLFYSYNLDVAREFKRQHPNCTVIIRDWPDDNVHLRETPEAWLSKRKHMAVEGMYLYTTNEPAFSNELINWHVALMKLAAAQNVRLVICNFSVGLGSPEDWRNARPMIDLLNQYRNLFVLGLHEYCGAVMTSGLYGGTPDNSGAPAGKPKNLLPVENWPMDVSGITCFHMGRHKFLAEYCRSEGIPSPRIIVTEWGFDFTGDIGLWLSSLVKTSPHTSINGWKTLREQWSRWFPQWPNPEDVFFFQAKWAETVLYQNVEAMLLFAWGDQNNWPAFDVSGAAHLRSKLETAPPPPPTTDPLPHPTIIPHENDSRWIGGVVKATSAVRVRADVSTTSPILLTVNPMEAVSYFSDPDEYKNWYAVKITRSEVTVIGFCRNDVIDFDDLPTPEPPPENVFVYPLPPPVVDAEDAQAVSSYLAWLATLCNYLAIKVKKVD